MTNGRMKCNGFFIANACTTMQYNFSSNTKKDYENYRIITEFIVKRKITKMNRNIFL